MTSISSVAVIGLGYVGLPLAILADNKGLKVFGIDINPDKIKSLNNKKSYIDDISDETVSKTGVIFTDDISRVAEVEAVIICVPTPVTPDKIPDLRPVTGAISGIAQHLKNGTLVVIESTINPGVCDEIVIPLIEKESGKKVGRDIYLAHCPERINPGDPKWNVSNINRVVGANSQPELDMAVELYRKLIDAEIKPMGNIKEAEAVKIIENSFRDVNIAFVNELAMSFHTLGINLENVIDGASTKPFSFLPHHPGCGVGGHCIPVDPYYMIEYAHSYGFEHNFLRLARDINESMPSFTVGLLTEALGKIGLEINGTRIALLGLSYKANIGDERESPARIIKELLVQAGADLVIFDPYVKSNLSVETLFDALQGAAAILIATGHDEFKAITTDQLKTSGIKVVIDGRNIFRNLKNEIQDQGLIYSGIGI